MKFNRLNDSFFTAYNKLMTLDISAKYALQLKRMSKVIEEEFKQFQDLYKGLIEKYKDADFKPEKDGQVKIQADKLSEFQDKVNELANEEINLKINKIPFSELTNSNISASDLIILEDFVDEDL